MKLTLPCEYAKKCNRCYPWVINGECPAVTAAYEAPACNPTKSVTIKIEHNDKERKEDEDIEFSEKVALLMRQFHS